MRGEGREEKLEGRDRERRERKGEGEGEKR